MKDTYVSVLDKTKSLGATYAEIRAQKNNNTFINVVDGQIEAVTLAKEAGAAVRVLADGAWGFSTTNSLSPKDLEKSAKSALTMAKTAGKSIRTPVKLAEGKPVEDTVKVHVKKDPREIDIKTKIDNLLSINSCFKFDQRIKSVTVRYADLTTEQTLGTTEGTFINQEKRVVWNYCWVTGKSNEIMASARDEVGMHGYELFDTETPESIAQRVSRRVIQQLEAKTPKGGEHRAIIGTNIVGVLAHEALGHICEADLTLAGSALMGKLGQKIADEKVTIYDTAPEDELIREVKDGYYVRSVQGAHQSNPDTGDFSVAITPAWRIMKGEIQHAVKGVMIAGNVYDLLNKIGLMGEETRQVGSFIAPKVVVTELNVISK